VFIGLGCGIGVLAGLLGVGGGFLVVPALTAGGGLGIAEAVGTSVAIVFMTSLSGAISHLALGHVAEAYRRHPLLSGAATLLVLAFWIWTIVRLRFRPCA
jgi:uncharacterized membrane protein YfcA